MPSKKKNDGDGLPPWVMTFADLMSLLMVFFVLLLSFSEMDVQKYRQIAGSMKVAFGVQKEIKVKDIPKGTSVIAREFTPGRPSPTSLNIMRQNTIDDFKQTLNFTDAITNTEEAELAETIQDFLGSDSDAGVAQSLAEADQSDKEETGQPVNEETSADAQKLIETFEPEIEQGMVAIETIGDKILIRIKEKGSFPSGSSVVKGSFLPVLSKLRNSLKTIDGKVIVAGHTDN
ncbi:MAG: flagellar motor protein MotB, partial [Gammaproteobacteria bacterium]